MKLKTLLMSAFAFVLSLALTQRAFAGHGSFVMIFNQALHSKLDPNLIAQYKKDLEQQGFFVKIIDWDYKENPFPDTPFGQSIHSHPDAPALKALLKDLYDHPEKIGSGAPLLEGALFVGKLPYILIQDHDIWTSGLYFMDLEHTWSDTVNDGIIHFANDGIYDIIDGGPGKVPIYIGILDASKIDMFDFNGDGPESEAALINYYFQKNHAYRAGEYLIGKPKYVAPRALQVDVLKSHNDYESDLLAKENNQLYANIAYPQATRFDKSGKTPEPSKENVIKYLSNVKNDLGDGNGAELFEVEAHGSAGAIGLMGPHPDGGALRNSDFAGPGANWKNLFADFGNCEVGSYNFKNSFAGVYIFRQNYGLTAIWGDENDMKEKEYFYQAFGGGETIGDAFKKSFNWYIEQEHPVSISLYSSILGDPTLKISQVNPEQLIPKITVKSYKIDDSAPLGNGNGILEPGDQAKLLIELENTGGDAQNILGTLTTDNTEVAILNQGQMSFGNIARFESGKGELIITTSPNWSSNIPFTLSLTAGVDNSVVSSYNTKLTFVVEKEFVAHNMVTISDPNDSLWGLTTADVNGDGLEDIVFYRVHGIRLPYEWETTLEAYSFINGSYQNIGSIPLSVTDFRTSRVTIGDLTGDGVAEIIVNHINSITIYSWDQAHLNFSLVASQDLIPTIIGKGQLGDIYYPHISIASLSGGKNGFILDEATRVTYNTLENKVIQPQWIWNKGSDDLLGPYDNTHLSVGNITHDPQGLKEVVLLISKTITSSQGIEYHWVVLDWQGKELYRHQEQKLDRPAIGESHLMLADLIGDEKLESIVQQGFYFFVLDSNGEKLAEFNAGPVMQFVIGHIYGDWKNHIITMSVFGDLKAYGLEKNNNVINVLKRDIKSLGGSYTEYHLVIGDVLGDDTSEIFLNIDDGFKVFDTQGKDLFTGDRYFESFLLGDFNGDGRPEFVGAAGKKVDIYDFRKSYNPQVMQWRMASYDPQMTWCFKDVKSLPQWVQKPTDTTFFVGENNAVSLTAKSVSSSNASLRFIFNGLPPEIQMQETVTLQGKNVILKWDSPSLAQQGLYPITVEVVDEEVGLKLKSKFNLSVTNLPFIRGDANMDGYVDISDGILILQYLFDQSNLIEFPTRLAAMDVNDDGEVMMSDAIYLFSYLFLPNGQPPPPPFPAAGYDTTP